MDLLEILRVVRAGKKEEPEIAGPDGDCRIRLLSILSRRIFDIFVDFVII